MNSLRPIPDDLLMLFEIGMDRNTGLFYRPSPGLHYNVGAGSKHIAGAISLGLPDWRWPRDRIPAEDGTVGLIHCYHFIEHLTGEDAIRFLMEAQRVLKVGGILNYCIPFYSSHLACEDLTHKSFWTEETFRVLFKNNYYDLTAEGFEWKLEVTCQLIAGVVERNLSMVGQLRKLA